MHATPTVKRARKGRGWGPAAHFDPKTPAASDVLSPAAHHNARRRVVKYVVGLALAAEGIHSFGDAADRLKIPLARLSSVLTCESRSRATQLALARLVGRRPIDLFAEFTHKDLITWPALPALDRDRIRVVLAAEGLAARDVARGAGLDLALVHRLLTGARRSPDGQAAILKAFRVLSGREISASEFWGAFLAKGAA